MNKTLAIIVGVIIIVVIIILVVIRQTRKQDTSSTASSVSSAVSSKDEPAPLKNIGFAFDAFDPGTNKAGDFEITPALKKIVTSDPIYGKRAWSDYGIQDNRSPNDPAKRNVQPTYYLPLGTKVLAPIDGVVTKVESIYSNDSTIWYSKDMKSTWSYETEHVKNVLVKVGDKVTAGQVVAEVSDYSSQNTPGYGLVELGLFHPVNNEPTHWCPFERLDASVKDEIGQNMMSFYAAWERFMGDTSIYDEGAYPIPGCATLEPTKG